MTSPAAAGRSRGRGGRRGSGSGGRREREDQRLVGGVHPVRELLRAGGDVHRLLLATGRGEDRTIAELIALADAAGVPVTRVERDELDQRTDGLVHQGVVAVAGPFRTVTLEHVLEAAARAGDVPLLVALDGVTDPHNLGSIARTAEAVGAHGLLLPGRRAAGITPTAEKSAAGALAHLPVVEVGNLVRTLSELAEAGVWSLGLDGDAEVALADHPLVGEPCVLVIGAEGAGLARLTRERCDGLVRLPMHGRIGSLNASVAAGIALYELRRQRDQASSA
ncbi:MAG: 23S rRNA (guanosine(2251)-2'-O)-methyltransferase RlmB [Nitriliruptoraceae bacterium]